jgi:anti-sigma regulatory factor (Ser/Thr protein kinase)
MRKHDFFKMTLPNDMSYLPVVQLSLKEVAKRFGFDDDAIYKIQLAMEEAYMNVVKHAFEADEIGTFDIICEQLPLGMKVIIKEKGMPFDPERLHVYNPLHNLEEADSGGLGIHLMREVMDEVSFRNLGPDGKETHLVKYLQGKNIEEYFETSELAPYAEAGKVPSPIVEKIPFVVRGMEPHEAIEISKGAYKSHGYTFFDSLIYFPDQIVELNRTGEMISVVAVTDRGHFMGHAALHYPRPDSDIAELTFVFVNPEYRSQGCMGKMLDFLFEAAKKNKLRGIYSFAVTRHMYSQRTILHHGLNDCGIELATSPATWVFKGIEENDPHRVSVVISFKYLAEQPPVTLFPPARHRVMVETLYRNIGSSNILATPGESRKQVQPEKSLLETSVYASEGNAEIFVRAYGKNIVREIKSMVRELCLEQISAINLFLSLEDPQTFFMVPEFEKMDFFFSGIMPMTGVGDALILQYLNNVAVDYDKVIAYSGPAKEILTYVRQNDPYASAGNEEDDPSYSD